MARVTVAMTVRDCAPYLREALVSIMSQTFRDFSLSIVDDGSCDETPEVLEAFAGPQVRVIRHPTPLGVARSLNDAIRASDSEFVCRMDGDDICHPDRIESQVSSLKERGDLMAVGSRIRLITGNGSKPGGIVRGGIRSSRLMPYGLCIANQIAHPTVMIRREALDRLGYYDESRTFEDYALWITAMLRGMKIAIGRRPLLTYRVLGTSASHSDDIGKLESVIDLVVQLWSELGVPIDAGTARLIQHPRRLRATPSERMAAVRSIGRLLPHASSQVEGGQDYLDLVTTTAPRVGALIEAGVIRRILKSPSSPVDECRLPANDLRP